MPTVWLTKYGLTLKISFSIDDPTEGDTRKTDPPQMYRCTDDGHKNR